MGTCKDTPDKYCGHVLEPDQEKGNQDWHQRVCNATCLREPKYDGSCVWHAETVQKGVNELVEARLTPEDVSWETDAVSEHLSGAILRGIEFPENFSFSECILVKSEFSNAYLRDAEFHAALLTEAKFSGAALTEADFSDATIEKAEFLDTDLRRTKFARSNLNNSRLHRANLRYAKLPDATLKGVEFLSAYIKWAKFPDADLRRADFSEAVLDQTSFQFADLCNAIFEYASLTQTDLRLANLVGANFNKSDLMGANLEEANIQNGSAKSADLTSVNLQKSNLEGMNFSGANLSGADLSGSNIKDVTLFQTEIENAKLRVVDFRKHSDLLSDKEKRETTPATQPTTEKNQTVNSDILLLSAMYKERDCLLTLLQDHEELSEKQGELGSRIFENSNSGRFIVKSEGETGNNRIRETAMSLIEHYDPRFVILHGIAAGFKNRVSKGDILIADKIVDLRKYKVENEGYSFEPNIISSPKHIEYPPNLKAIKEEIDSVNLSFELHTDMIIGSSDTLSRDRKFMESAKKVHRKLGGLEMEGAGIAEACNKKNVGFYIIKSISDYGGGDKDDSLHAECCNLAAEVVLRGFLSKIR